ncbi:hypothetical protein BCR33DRAFT_722482 [Rhizoclosmatium globosum]|uniref:Uncharacterized protein n=1 Tax=Rhizoclosmatium globosum TaxID=329046 RepID=A0A1Y2BMP3_9FUNG|nr:hypothetical protein BCR33DRAFT_722482 [Rhizoclosmatium globosum]|eukprot:ORY36013.1 hypothetical protein BCR33DRAFT_722482 [Rhizoclosmatium globosum]
MDPFLYVVMHTSLLWISLFLQLFLTLSKQNDKKTPTIYIIHIHNWSFIAQMVVTLIQCTSAKDIISCWIMSIVNVEGAMLQMICSNIYIASALIMLMGTKGNTLWNAILVCIPSMGCVLRILHIDVAVDETQLPVFNVCDFTLSWNGIYISDAILCFYSLAFLVALTVLSNREPEMSAEVKAQIPAKVRIFKLMIKIRLWILPMISVVKGVCDILLRRWPTSRLLVLNLCLFLDFLLLNVEILAVQSQGPRISTVITRTIDRQDGSMKRSMQTSRDQSNI